MDFNKANVTKLGNELKELLEQFAADHDLVLKYKGGRFDPAVGTFKPRIELEAANAAQRQFEQDAPVLGLSSLDFGRQFESRGETYVLDGINLRARRFPLLGTSLKTGKRFKFAESAVAAWKEDSAG